MSKRKVKQLYFTRHDSDLWEAIQSLPEGDQNHEMRKALRAHFLGEAASLPSISPQIKPDLKPSDTPKNEAAVSSAKLPGSLVR
ncbi:hypothetical protein [Paenibacillus sp. MMO-58]|uniref:hypothetical protein n=1 Tax=Paenibacillus sp. MMO-58 TaxID=3081290 RepID=UPI003019C14E